VKEGREGKGEGGRREGREVGRKGEGGKEKVKEGGGRKGEGGRRKGEKGWEGESGEKMIGGGINAIKGRGNCFYSRFILQEK
jgi:hypothetical protein